MFCWWHRTRRRRSSVEGKMTVSSASSPAAAVVFLLVISFAPAESSIHTVKWNLEGVKAYSVSNPLMVKINDLVVLECDDDSGNFAYSNVIVQPDRSQYDQCNCMTSQLVSCGDDYSYGFCAVGLQADVVVTVSQQSASLDAVYNFEPGKMTYLVSYANSNTSEGAQNEVFLGGDCTRGLKLPVMIAALPTMQPPTTPTPTSDGMGISGDMGASGIPNTSPSTPTISSSTTSTNSNNNNKDDSSDDDKSGESQAGGQDKLVHTESPAKKKLQDWHLAAIGVLVGILIVSVVVFLVVVAVLFVRRPTAPLAPGDSCDGEVTEEKGAKNGTIVRNVGAVPGSPTSTMYPGGLFNDPLDN